MKSVRRWLWSLLGAGAGLVSLGVGCRGGTCESCFGCLGTGFLVAAGLTGHRFRHRHKKEVQHGMVKSGH